MCIKNKHASVRVPILYPNSLTLVSLASYNQEESFIQTRNFPAFYHPHVLPRCISHTPLCGSCFLSTLVEYNGP